MDDIDKKMYPRTDADRDAEDFEKMADEGGLFDAEKAPEPVEMLSRLERRRDIKRGRAAIDSLIEEATMYHDAMTRDPFDLNNNSQSGSRNERHKD